MKNASININDENSIIPPKVSPVTPPIFFLTYLVTNTLRMIATQAASRAQIGREIAGEGKNVGAATCRPPAVGTISESAVVKIAAAIRVIRPDAMAAGAPATVSLPSPSSLA